MNINDCKKHWKHAVKWSTRAKHYESENDEEKSLLTGEME